jgi:hypothetical protein
MVVVFGLAAAFAAISVHGSADERAAIRHAVRAPLLDLRRRDARALCDDFTAGVEAHLAPGGGCDSRLAQDFRLAGVADLYPPIDRTAPASHMHVTAISWHGDRASATSFFSGDRASVRHWRLRRVGRTWRIATPATLQLRADCPRRAPVKQVCAYAVSMRLANEGPG